MVSVVLVTLLMSFYIPYKLGKNIRMSKTIGTSNMLRSLTEGSVAEVKNVVSDSKISVSLCQMQHLELDRDVRRAKNKQFVICLANSQAEAFTAMKKRVNKETCMKIIEDFSHTPSRLGNIKDAMEDLNTLIKKKFRGSTSFTWTSGVGCCDKFDQGHRFLCSTGVLAYAFKLAKMIFSYLDFVKDISLTLNLIILTSVQVLFSKDFTLFQSVIVWLMMFSVGAPLLLSAIQTAIYYPTTLLDFHTWRSFTGDPPGEKKLLGLRISTFFAYLFVPSTQINNKAEAQERKEILLENTKTEFNAYNGTVSIEISEELEQLEKYLDEVRKAHLIFKRNEAALELVPQQSIQLVMLLLSLTNYPAVNGLQAVFGKKVPGTAKALGAAETFLILSVAWSFKTGSASFIKIRTESKSSFLPATAKAALGLRALFFSSARICSFAAFFGPFLGLLDCLAHWHAQKLQLQPELLHKITNNSNSYWDKETANILFRSAEDTTNYTLVTLQHAFFIFLGLLVLHNLAIFALKMATSVSFRRARWQTKLLHLMESTNVPDTYMDWDDEDEDAVGRKLKPEDYRIRWRSVLQETVGMIGLQMFSNLTMLIPIFITGELHLDL